MTSEKHTILACCGRAAGAAGLFAAQNFLALQTLVALQTPAQAQMATELAEPALFVAPDVMLVAAPTGTPAAMPAMAAPGSRPAPSDVLKPAALAPPAAPAATRSIACSAPAEFSHLDRPLVR